MKDGSSETLITLFCNNSKLAFSLNSALERSASIRLIEVPKLDVSRMETIAFRITSWGSSFASISSMNVFFTRGKSDLSSVIYPFFVNRQKKNSNARLFKWRKAPVPYFLIFFRSWKHFRNNRGTSAHLHIRRTCSWIIPPWNSPSARVP